MNQAFSPEEYDEEVQFPGSGGYLGVLYAGRLYGGEINRKK